MPSLIDVPAGTIVGRRPYFLSVGQSCGPMRSKPLMPRSAAILQHSSRSRDVFGPNTPRVTACFRRPLRSTAARTPAAPPNARADAPAAGRKLRRVICLYGRGRRAARQMTQSGLERRATELYYRATPHGPSETPPHLHARRDAARAGYRNSGIHADRALA